MTPLTGYVVMLYGTAFLNVCNRSAAFTSVGAARFVRDQASDLVYIQTTLLAPGVRRTARQLE